MFGPLCVGCLSFDSVLCRTVGQLALLVKPFLALPVVLWRGCGWSASFARCLKSIFRAVGGVESLGVVGYVPEKL